VSAGSVLVSRRRESLGREEHPEKYYKFGAYVNADSTATALIIRSVVGLWSGAKRPVD